MAVVCLSVCMSCTVPDPKSRVEGRSKLKIDRKEARDICDPLFHLEIKKSNACRGGKIFAPHSLCVLQGR